MFRATPQTNKHSLMAMAAMILLGVVANSSSSLAAAGASRVAHFNASGINQIDTTEVKDSTLKTSCLITITNISGQSQDYTFTGNASYTTQLGSGSISGSSAVAWTATGGGTSGTLATGSSVTFVATYGILAPQILTSNLPSKQYLTCSGSITVADTDATLPGFIVASGTLGTMSESAAGYQNSGGTKKITGSVAISQIPITIGEGRPF